MTTSMSTSPPTATAALLPQRRGNANASPNASPTYAGRGCQPRQRLSLLVLFGAACAGVMLGTLMVLSTSSASVEAELGSAILPSTRMLSGGSRIIQSMGSTGHVCRKRRQLSQMRQLETPTTRSRAAIFGDGGAWQRQNPDEFPEEVENPLDKLPDPSRKTATVDGVEWSYLRTDVGPSSKPTILCTHGILSAGYSFRDTLKFFQRDGYDAIAIDWPGFGESDKPDQGFDYSPGAYTSALAKFLETINVDKPIVLVTQGYILGQYGILFAAENPTKIENLVILNSPLGAQSKLPNPLGSYQGFMKSFAFGKTPDAGMYHAAGGPYAFEYKDFQTLQAPYEADDKARVAFEAIMDKLNWQDLLKKVSLSTERFKKPSLILWGSDDRYLDIDQALSWLETKPTSTKLFALPATCGHFPQFDFPELMVETIERFINGEDYKAPTNVKSESEKVSSPDF